MEEEMSPPTEDEFRIARDIAADETAPMTEEAYQVCRWFRGQMFLRKEAQRALVAIRNGELP